MSKHKLTLSVNKDVIKRAREHEINISNFLEIKLREYMALIERNKTKHTSKSIDNYSLNMIRKEVDSLSKRSKSK